MRNFAESVIDAKSIVSVAIAALYVLLNVLERHVFGDLTLIGSMVILVGIDTALGVWVAVRKDDLSSKGLGQVAKKILIYMALIASAFHIAVMSGDAVQGATFATLRIAVTAVIAGREGLSIFEKCALLGAPMPPAIINILRVMRDGKLTPNHTQDDDQKPTDLP